MIHRQEIGARPQIIPAKPHQAPPPADRRRRGVIGFDEDVTQPAGWESHRTVAQAEDLGRRRRHCRHS